MPFPIKNIDFKKAKAIGREYIESDNDENNLINVSKKTTIIEDELYLTKDIISSNKSVLGYLLFAFNEVEEKYNISQDRMVLLLYLKELWVFGSTLDIKKDKSLRLNYFITNNIIERSYNSEDRLYTLSSKGNEIVDCFISALKNPYDYSNLNRKTGVDVGIKLSSVLNKFFK